MSFLIRFPKRRGWAHGYFGIHNNRRLLLLWLPRTSNQHTSTRWPPGELSIHSDEGISTNPSIVSSQRCQEIPSVLGEGVGEVFGGRFCRMGSTRSVLLQATFSENRRTDIVIRFCASRSSLATALVLRDLHQLRRMGRQLATGFVSAGELEGGILTPKAPPLSPRVSAWHVDS